MIGKRLNKNILSPFGLLLLPQGIVLTRKHLNFLRDYGVHLLDDDVEDAPPVSIVVNKAVDEWKHIFQTAKNSERIFFRSITEQAAPLIRTIADQYDLQSALSELAVNDDYTYHHSVAVAILSTVIGKWSGLPEHRLRSLTVAALLHDIGKAKIPSYLLTKPGSLTTDEFELMKKHTSFGFEMIMSEDSFGEEHAVAALQHHERLDGSGYPNGIRDIHPFGRIVAVADVFHAMLSKRPYQDPAPLYKALKELHGGAFGKFDPEVVSVFAHRAMEALIGNEVLLSNGQRGKIVSIHPHEVWKPLVKCRDRFVDLSVVPDLHISRL